ncbi:MAG: hypothetical protein HC829_06075 [Bacteroidales bacterium]|nr:hypothetical protein [Bacteroidales bacterium]
MSNDQGEPGALPARLKRDRAVTAGVGIGEFERPGQFPDLFGHLFGCFRGRFGRLLRPGGLCRGGARQGQDQEKQKCVHAFVPDGSVSCGFRMIPSGIPETISPKNP